MNEPLASTRSSRGLGVILLMALAWPPAYAFFVHPYASSLLSPQPVSNEEIQKLLKIRRYTLDVPHERDGWLLSLEAVVDGKAERRGGSSVQGGSNIVLLVRQITHTDEIEYCWYHGSTVTYNVMDDPLKDAGVSATKGEGPIEEGDWLLRGARRYYGTEPAEFELRVVLHPPSVDDETEPPHALEPAAGPDSDGPSSPPAQ